MKLYLVPLFVTFFVTFLAWLFAYDFFYGYDFLILLFTLNVFLINMIVNNKIWGSD